MTSFLKHRREYTRSTLQKAYVVISTGTKWGGGRNLTKISPLAVEMTGWVTRQKCERKECYGPGDASGLGEGLTLGSGVGDGLDNGVTLGSGVGEGVGSTLGELGSGEGIGVGKGDPDDCACPT